jgi:hypothetical protein
VRALALLVLLVAAGPVAAAPGRWEPRAPMLSERTEVAGAVLAGTIYVAGGVVSGGAVTAAVEAYDPSADAWTSGAPMPTPRHGLAAVALGGRIHVVSGGPRPGVSCSGAREVFAPDEGR